MLLPFFKKQKHSVIPESMFLIICGPRHLVKKILVNVGQPVVPFVSDLNIATIVGAIKFGTNFGTSNSVRKTVHINL